MEIRPVGVDATSLAQCERLFNLCFPTAKHLTAQYLRWLYLQNPAGPVIGCNAWDGTVLAAHYACVPVDAVLGGRTIPVMLSLNTATHPDYQGRGLFTRLAEATFAAGADAGIEAVYGVANANSTPGFTRKLGFALIRPLDAVIGIGPIDCAGPSDLLANADFTRSWSAAALRWRVSNPVRPYRLVRTWQGMVGAEARTGLAGIRAWAEVPSPPDLGAEYEHRSLALRLHIGLRPQADKASSSWIHVPRRLRPSPLNLIFRPLRPGVRVPEADAIRLGQLDFDAF